MKKTALFTVVALVLVALLAFGFAGCHKKTLEYRITCEGGDEVVTVVSDGKTAEIPAGVKTGYLFRRWTNKDGSDFVLSSWLADKKKHDIKIFGRFDPVSFTVSFDGNGNTGGVAMNNMSFVYDREQMLPANTYVKKGMRLAHWEYAGGTCADSAVVKNLSAEDGAFVVLKAVWEPAGYNLTFDARGGTVEPGTAGPFAYMGEYDVSEVVPERAGYVFGGWYANELTGVTSSFDDKGFYPFSGDVTVFAEWEPDKYELSYECETPHGNPAGDMGYGTKKYYTVESGELALEDPSDRPGYVFDGWYDEDGERVEKIFGGMIGDNTLTARWTMAADGSADLKYRPAEDGTYFILDGRGATGARDLAVPADHDGKPVKEISDGAFAGMTSIMRAELPDTIEKIGTRAFRGCGNMISINIPSSVKTLGPGAFAKCGNLEKVLIDSPVAAKDISTAAPELLSADNLYIREGLEIDPRIADGTGLIRITSPDDPGMEEGYVHYSRLGGETEIDGLVYRLHPADDDFDFNYADVCGLYVDPAADPAKAEPVTAVEIPGTVTSLGIEFTVTAIDDKAFSGYAKPECVKIETVSIPASVRILGNEAFHANGKTALRSVTFGEGSLLERIGHNAFRDCGKLAGIEIPAGVREIDYCVFENCLALKSVTFGEGSLLDNISERAFENCRKLGEIDLPASVEYIYDDAFSSSGLVEIVIPASVKRIGWSVFRGCPFLESVKFEEGSVLERIGPLAFLSSSLRYLELPASLAPDGIGIADDGRSPFNTVSLDEVVIDSPETIKAMNSLSGWVKELLSNNPEIYIPADEAVKIGGGYGALLLEHFEMPSGKEGYVRYIAPELKRNGLRYSIVRADDGSLVANLAGSVSYGFGMDVLIPGELHAHGTTFPVRGIDYDAFCGLYVNSVLFDEGCVIESIGGDAFREGDMESIVIPASVKTIGLGAFYDCSDLETVFIDSPEVARNITRSDVLGSDLLDNCRDLYIKASLETDPDIGERCFRVEGETAGSEGYEEGYVHYAMGVEKDGLYYMLTSRELMMKYEGLDFDAAVLVGFAGPEIVAEAKACSSAEPAAPDRTAADIPASVTAFGREFRVWKIKDSAFKNCDELKTVSIPASVEFIGDNAFGHCTSLTSVTFAEGIKLSHIPDYMFAHCYNLKEITIPASVKSIAAEAFRYCYALSAVRFEKGSVMTTIPNVFYYSEALRHMEIPAKVSAIGCEFGDLDEVIIDSPVVIEGLNGPDAWGKLCSGKPFVYIPEAEVEKLGSAYGSLLWNKCARIVPDREGYAKYADAALSRGGVKYSIVRETDPVSGEESLCVYAVGTDGAVPADLLMPKSVSAYGIEFPLRKIAGSAFYGCSVRTLAFEDGCEPIVIDSNAFHSCGSLVSVSIPAFVKTIGKSAFEGCNKLENVVFAPEGLLETIPDNAFMNCGLAGDLAIPAGVKTVGSGAFRGCGKLESVTIPASVESVAANAFTDCGALERIIVDSASVADNLGGCLGPDGLWDTFADLYAADGLDVDSKILTSGTFMKAAGTEEPGHMDGYVHYGNAMHAASGDLFFAIDVDPAGSVNEAFVAGGIEGLSSVEIPASVSVFGYDFAVAGIGEEAFYEHKELRSVSIPASVNFIADGAFCDCCRLETVTFAEGSKLESVGEYAFAGSPVRSIEIPASVNVMGEGALCSCPHLSSVTFGEGIKLTILPDGAFDNCRSLKEMTIPASVESIGSYAFGDCVALESLRFGKDSALATIGSYAFDGCEALGHMEIPAKVSAIGCEFGDLDEVIIDSPVVIEGLNGPDAWGGLLAGKPLVYIPEAEVEKLGGAYGSLLWNKCARIASDRKGYAEYVYSRIEKDGLLFMIETDINPETGLPAKSVVRVSAAADVPENVIVPGSAEGYGRTFEVRGLDEGAFDGTAIASLAFADGAAVKEIPAGACFECVNLRSAEIPSGAKSIGAEAFCGCDRLESVLIPAAVETIAAGAFKDCHHIVSLTVDSPAIAKGIASTFLDCELLKSAALDDIYIKKGLEADAALGTEGFIKAAEGAPEGYERYHSKIIDADGITYMLSVSADAEGKNVYEAVVYQYEETADLAIPASVSALGYDFTVVGIDDSTFDADDTIETVRLPATLKTIDSGNFYNCFNMKKVFIDSPDIVKGYVSPCFDNAAAVYVPEAEVSKLSAEAGHEYGAALLSANRVRVASDEEGYAEYVLSEIVRDGVIYAIRTETDPETKVMNSFMEAVGHDDSGIPAELLLPAALHRYGLTLPLRAVGNSAFEGSAKLDTVLFDAESSVRTIGEAAFRDSSLRFIRIPKCVGEIKAGAFDGCAKLETVMADSPAVIKALVAPGACGGIADAGARVYVPDAEISKLSAEAGHEYGARLLSGDIVRIPSDKKGYALFVPSGVEHEALKYTLASGTDPKTGDVSVHAVITGADPVPAELEIPDAIPAYGLDVPVTAVGKEAFKGTALTALLIPAGVGTMGEGAFDGCAALNAVFIDSPDIVKSFLSPFFDAVPAVYVPDAEVSKLSAEAGHEYGAALLSASRVRVTSDKEGYAEYVLAETVSDGVKYTIKTDEDPVTGELNSTVSATGHAEDLPATVTMNDTVSACGRTFPLTAIGKEAFKDCGELTSILFGPSVISIGESAFAGCALLKEITFTGTKDQWNALAAASAGWNTGSYIERVHCSDGDVELAVG